MSTWNEPLNPAGRVADDNRRQRRVQSAEVQPSSGATINDSGWSRAQRVEPKAPRLRHPRMRGTERSRLATVQTGEFSQRKLRATTEGRCTTSGGTMSAERLVVSVAALALVTGAYGCSILNRFDDIVREEQGGAAGEPPGPRRAAGGPPY